MEGVTNVDLHFIVETFCSIRTGYRIQDEDGETVPRNKQQLKEGGYIVVAGSVIVTDEIPLRRTGPSVETGTRLASFCDAVRKRDGKCVITGNPAVLGHMGRFRHLDACHVFPLAHKGKWDELRYDSLFDRLINKSDGYYLNSVRNGILLDCGLHRYFDAGELTINADVGMASSSSFRS